jgi:hypothetical protein
MNCKVSLIASAALCFFSHFAFAIEKRDADGAGSSPPPKVAPIPAEPTENHGSSAASSTASAGAVVSFPSPSLPVSDSGDSLAACKQALDAVDRVLEADTGSAASIASTSATLDGALLSTLADIAEILGSVPSAAPLGASGSLSIMSSSSSGALVTVAAAELPNVGHSAAAQASMGAQSSPMLVTSSAGTVTSSGGSVTSPALLSGTSAAVSLPAAVSVISSSAATSSAAVASLSLVADVSPRSNLEVGRGSVAVPQAAPAPVRLLDGKNSQSKRLRRASRSRTRNSKEQNASVGHRSASLSRSSSITIGAGGRVPQTNPPAALARASSIGSSSSPRGNQKKPSAANVGSSAANASSTVGARLPLTPRKSGVPASTSKVQPKKAAVKGDS